MKVWQLMLSGLFVHVVLFYSIFDIYFKSPLVHGMEAHVSSSRPLAKRLVLFSADGLRADHLFEADSDRRPRAPYIRNIIETEGHWGVSHTRVPTESRPGHVALIAGFYEDVSAVAKGWKENPVEFDSFFNESRYTWSWGSPDILPMFAKGASGGHVFTHCYSAEEEDFAHYDPGKLDTWAFDKATELFSSAKKNKTLMHMLHQDKIVFFLHLLAIDTIGHSSKPHSSAYYKDVLLVDKGIKAFEKLMDEFYNNDGRTAYVMSSDHGMTDWGSHGAGSPAETLTPLVAWGAGIHKPNKVESCGSYKDSFCDDWNLKNFARFDVEQADVAALMSYLIGVPYPKNSLGVLPLNYLASSLGNQSEGIFANAQQIMAQYQVKMAEVKERTVSVVFRPFSELTPSKQAGYIRHIRQLIKTGNFEEAISQSKDLINTALQGLSYYQKYDRLFLGLSVVLSFLGWMAYILQQLLHTYTWFSRKTVDKAGHLLQTTVNKGGVVAGLAVSLILFIQSSPATYYLYCLLPVVLWTKVLHLEVGYSMLQRALLVCYRDNHVLPVLSSVTCCMLGIEILVHGFFQRELLSVGLVAIALWSMTSGNLKECKFSAFGWLFSCLALAIFPLLPVVGRNANYMLVITSGVAAFVLGSVMVYRLGVLTNRSRNNNGISGVVMGIQLAFILAAVWVVKTTSDGIRAQKGVPAYNHMVSWCTLGLCPLWPLMTSTSLLERLASLALTFIAPYLLMSITYEIIFLLVLLSVIYFWLEMEQRVSESGTRKVLIDADFTSSQQMQTHQKDSPVSRWLQLADLRRAFFFVFFILTAFFGTGNIASINSFDPASVYCFLTVFNPFVMGSVMMLKNIIPFILVTCAFRAVHVVTHIPVQALFLLVLVMSDVMGLHFFFLIKDYGSWLDIGTSISHYVIVMTMIIAIMLLLGISHILTCCRLPLIGRKFHSR